MVVATNAANATAPAATAAATWHVVCRLGDILPDSGVAALIDKRQIAVFRRRDRQGAEHVHALANFDPFSKAMVMSRGILGSVGETPTVASPVYKQRFDLRSGQCVDDATVAIAAYPVRVVEGMIQVAV